MQALVGQMAEDQVDDAPGVVRLFAGIHAAEQTPRGLHPASQVETVRSSNGLMFCATRRLRRALRARWRSSDWDDQAQAGGDMGRASTRLHSGLPDHRGLPYGGSI